MAVLDAAASSLQEAVDVRKQAIHLNHRIGSRCYFRSRVDTSHSNKIKWRAKGHARCRLLCLFEHPNQQ
ncbi:hypothetical protein R3I94_007757 [Phoxinus phoxinus]